ncbi:MAG TPA: alpha-hydroxy acid oxidase [Xanthobacteraceae bacterium]|jgi:L-lactate dehydrogenase (cytochrome)|nr:alpha-hydroxy acid oxidase [Xanthobacteraceae bacterium]
MAVVTNIEDLRRLAMRRCPRVMFDYVDSGSYDEVTRDANRAELAAIRFRQRVLVDTTGRSMAAEMLGQTLSMPLAIAPTGLTGLVYGDGEILAARAAEAEGSVYTLSTMSICTIEDVRAATRKPFWFQLYVFRDRGFSEEIIGRARDAQCPVLFVTVDLPQRGQRHCDLKNGLTVPPRLTLRNAFDIATKPGWVARVLLGKRKTFGNIDEYLRRKNITLGTANWSQTHFDQSLNWRDIDWIRKLWPGKLVLKGILDVEDARTAVAAGADGIVVSNHGGRQLDGAPATIRVLPEIASAVGDRTEVLFDGGIRSGQDVMKALALGARGCMIGRAYLYGLAAMGEAGVRRAIDIIRQEMAITMMLTGTHDLRKVPREILYEPAGGALRN